MKSEQIGQVILNLDHYSGTDLYSDGAVEDKLLDIAMHYEASEYNKVIKRENDWAVFYHFSPLRTNILRWMPMTADADVLEIGSGCGAITGALAEKAHSVTCIDLSKKRSMVNAYRNKDRENVQIHVGNFLDVEKTLEQKYDIITLIGVFEYGQGYIGGNQPYHDFLQIIKKHLKPGGQIWIAIENKFGLKYWAGCTEDHYGTYFTGIEDYHVEGVAKTFSKAGLAQIATDCGLTQQKFYYPYPDYKFATTMYTDAYLPKKGELNQNMRNFDRERMLLFDETKVYDMLVEEGKFDEYANSYFLVLTADAVRETEKVEVDTTEKGQGVDRCSSQAGIDSSIAYVKLSNDRADAFNIQTVITSENSEKKICKKPDTDLAAAHVAHIKSAYEKLSEIYRDSKIEMNRCELLDIASGVNLEYLQGHTLEELCDSYLQQGEKAQAIALILAVAAEIRNVTEKTAFTQTPEFEKVFGHHTFPEELQAASVANIDMILGNILVVKTDAKTSTVVERLNGNAKEMRECASDRIQSSTKKGIGGIEEMADTTWTAIDYEWTFDFPLPLNYVVYRMMHYYMETSALRSTLRDEAMYEKLGITAEETAVYEEMEQQFQIYVDGGHAAVRHLYAQMGKPVYPVREMIAKNHNYAQIFWDTGKGYSEEESSFVNAENIDGDFDFTIEIPQGVRKIRIDPLEHACTLRIHQMQINGSDVTTKVTTNGYALEEREYIYATNDPIVEVVVSQEQSYLHMAFHVESMDVVIAEQLLGKMDKKFKLKQVLKKRK